MPTAAHALFSPSFLTHPIQSHSLPSLTHAHAHTHTLAHTRTHSLTPTHTHSHTRTIIINIMSCSKTSKPKEDKEREGRPEWKSNQQIFRLQRHFLQFFSFFLSSLIVMTSSRAAASYLSALTDKGSRNLVQNLAEPDEPIKHFSSWGAALHRGSVTASHPAAPGSILGVPKNFSEFLMLLRLIDTTF